MTNFNDITRSFLELHALAPEFFMPIENGGDLERATAFLYAFDEAKGEHSHALAPLADALMHRIMVYEAEHSPIPDADGPMMLAFYLEQKGLTQKQLAAATGIQQATISQLLNRKRAFTADHARKLGEFFGGEPGLFL